MNTPTPTPAAGEPDLYGIVIKHMAAVITLGEPQWVIDALPREFEDGLLNRQSVMNILTRMKDEMDAARKAQRPTASAPKAEGVNWKLVEEGLSYFYAAGDIADKIYVDEFRKALATRELPAASLGEGLDPEIFDRLELAASRIDRLHAKDSHNFNGWESRDIRQAAKALRTTAPAPSSAGEGEGLIRFDWETGDPDRPWDSKVITHDEMRQRYADMHRQAMTTPKPEAGAVGDGEARLYNVLKAIDERGITQATWDNARRAMADYEAAALARSEGVA